MWHCDLAKKRHGNAVNNGYSAKDGTSEEFRDAVVNIIVVVIVGFRKINTLILQRSCSFYCLPLLLF